MDVVSCIITTHKREPKIVERALLSILNQTYRNIEVFVVDDSPLDFKYRDSVREMVESYEERNVTYIPHVNCMGACVARNTGLENCNGKYIAFLDDDDEWKPEKIEMLLNGFTNENIALVYCGRVLYNDTTRETRVRNPEIHTGMVYDELILKNFIGSTSYPLLKADCLKEIGGFDPLMQSAQDYDVWLRLARKYEVNYVDEPLIVYHVHEGEQITKNPIKRISGLERICEKNIDYLSKNKYAYWVRINGILTHYIDAKMYGKALKKWFEAVSKKPFKIKGNANNLYNMFVRTVTNIRDRNK